MATINEPQDDDTTVPLREYIRLGFENIHKRLDAAQNERAELRADIDRVSARVDKVDGRIDRLMFAIIGADVVLSAAVIGAAAAIIASQ